ncbi:MBL fold metallo-hydrolase [Streptomyces glomeratus]|uniref:MBL fold metallo-hydrolase n=1 Tax=Streptomyces glomeratus TaxID=284452 RepID=A0ABP6LK59_9ACTN
MLIDSGPKGCGAAIVEAITALGQDPSQVRRIVLTHFHEDHAGGADEIAARSGADVFAHHSCAPIVRGRKPGPAPVFEDWERPLHAAAAALLPQGDPLRPDRVRDVSDGDVLGFGGGARVVHVPGHTHGSIALHLAHQGPLFTGDAVAVSPVDGGVLLGVFNLDRDRAVRSLHRLAALDVEVACFGHGDPVLGRAGDALCKAADRYDAPRRGHGTARQPTGTPASRYSAAPRSRARSAQRRRS